MEVTLLHKLSQSVGISDMAYSIHLLALSLDNSTVLIYSFSSLASFELVQTIEVPQDPISLYWHGSDLLIGTSEGTLILYTSSDQTFRTEMTISIHDMDIKSVCGYLDTVFTCGIDNYISTIQLSSLEVSAFKLLNKVKAHEGWVYGMCVCYPYLVSQGSDSKTVVWRISDMNKVFVLNHEFDEIQECLICIQKPFIDSKWVSLSNVCSSLNGESCAMLIEVENWRLVEIPMIDFEQVCEGDSLKRKPVRSYESIISMSMNTSKGMILATNAGLALLNTQDFTYKASYDFSEQLEISSLVSLPTLDCVLGSTLEGKVLLINLTS